MEEIIRKLAVRFGHGAMPVTDVAKLIQNPRWPTAAQEPLRSAAAFIGNLPRPAHDVPGFPPPAVALPLLLGWNAQFHGAAGDLLARYLIAPANTVRDDAFEQFDHLSAAFFLAAPPLPRRIVMRARRYLRGHGQRDISPLTEAVEEQHPQHGTTGLATLVMGQLGDFKRVNNSDVKLASAPPSRRSVPGRLHLAWPLGTKGMKELKSCPLPGLVAVLLDDWREVWSGLPMTFVLHRRDSRTTCRAGTRWQTASVKNAGPPPAVTRALFGRQTHLEAARLLGAATDKPPPAPVPSAAPPLRPPPWCGAGAVEEDDCRAWTRWLVFLADSDLEHLDHDLDALFQQQEGSRSRSDRPRVQALIFGQADGRWTTRLCSQAALGKPSRFTPNHRRAHGARWCLDGIFSPRPAGAIPSHKTDDKARSQLLALRVAMLEFVLGFAGDGA